MKRLQLLFVVFMIALGSSSCALVAPPAPTPDNLATETEIASNIFATQTASAPTVTRAPAVTDTRVPTIPPRATFTIAARPTLTPLAAELVVTSTLPSGWIQYGAQSWKFTIALPTDWKRLDLSRSGLDNGLAVIGELNPNYSSVFSSQTLRKLVTSGLRFYALDASPAARAVSFPTTVNVLQVDIGVALPLDSIVAATLEQIKNTADPSVPLTHRRLTLSNIEAEEFQYANKLTMPVGQPILLMAKQYLIIVGTNETVLTFGSPKELADQYTSVFEEIAQTFQLLK